jgi:hypothetical protein
MWMLGISYKEKEFPLGAIWVPHEDEYEGGCVMEPNPCNIIYLWSSLFHKSMIMFLTYLNKAWKNIMKFWEYIFYKQLLRKIMFFFGGGLWFCMLL